jgi:acyl-CoA dehydrogenase
VLDLQPSKQVFWQNMSNKGIDHMDFALSSTQIRLRQQARDFARQIILPATTYYDHAAIFPQELFRQALESNLLNLGVPSVYGGPEQGVIEQVLICEEMAWSCTGICAALNLNALAVFALLLGGTSLQKSIYFPRLLAGDLCSFAVTEPEAGSDIAAIQTTALLDEQAESYILNGHKIWISNAPSANFFILLAKTTPEQGHRGISLFLIERDTPGLTVGPARGKLGQHATPAADLILENVRLPLTALLGEQDQGFKLAMQIFDRSRPLVAAYGLGLIQRCLDEALAYAQKRHSMGKPLIEHEAIGNKIADIAMRLEAGRLLTYQAAWLLDTGQPNTLQAAYAKAFTADTAMWTATETLQIFGSAGYSTDLPIEKLLRDAKLLQIYEGTSEIQRLIIKKELLRR